MLNEMRLGKITDDTIRAFRKLSRPIKYEDALDATELHVYALDHYYLILIVMQLSHKK